ncbi:membrane protein [Streptomyces virens]|uniref:Membrane protein n=1 Tax=Streptomyces virens TaxID=285572 RepID=A0ABP6PVU9_9ACTN|nr:hypothetical protein [Streptomyces calvus]MBA8976334.1 hypothetical protein [Streptomyces calvus]
MADPLPLRPEDRPDFEAVLRRALTTTDIRETLDADPSGRAAARLRRLVLANADEIAAAAHEEYGAYVTLRAAGRPGTARRPAAAGTLLPALTVLTPLVATASAAALLVLGHLLRLTDARDALTGSLITAGWVLTLIAGVSALLAFAALLRTAMRGGDDSVHAARLRQARLDWQRALLERGILPRLRRYLRADPAAGPPAASGRRPHL